jgi:CheY-like chemotaxis protein
MINHNEPILIVSDNELELEEIKLHLSNSYSRIYDVADEDVAIHLFEKRRAALLLLSFRSLKKAEKFYLKLFHRCENIYEIPHQVIVFVARSELERAYELCRRGIFYSFVIVRPLLSEYFVRHAVSHALDKRRSHEVLHRGRKLLRRLAEQVDHLRGEFEQLMLDNRTMREQQKSAQHGLIDSIKDRLSVFRDSLMGPSMQKIVTVHDKGALTKKFEQLQEGEIVSQLSYYHGKMDDAVEGWTGSLEKHLSLLEHASIDAQEVKQWQPPQIMIIDDDEIQRHMLSSVLEAEGYAVQQAASGNEGMSLLLVKVPDLVLLDYEMPDLDGGSLLRKARRHPLLKDLPFIMLTGHSEKEVVQLCMNIGANDYLVKPVQVQRLYERLEHFIAKPVPPQKNPVISI